MCATTFRAIAATLLLVPASAGIAASQPYWSTEFGRGGFRIELLKPFFKGPGDAFLTGAAFVEGGLHATSSIPVEADIPFARARTGVSSSDLGNPYLGVRLHKPGSSVNLRIGVRLPTASEEDDALLVGQFADFDRWEAFLPKVFTTRAAIEWNSRQASGLLVGVVVGPSFMVNTEGGDPELLGDYGVRLGYDGPKAYAAAELTGRIVVTEEGDLSERTVHQLTGSIELRPGRVRPHVRVRLPLDESFREAVGVIVGAGVKVLF